MVAPIFVGYIFIFLVITIINYKAGKKDVLYPAFIYSSLWTTVFTAYVFSPIEVNAISSKTCFLLLFGLIAFSVGCYMGRIFYIKNQAVAKDRPFSNSGKYFLLFYCFIVFPWYFKDIITASGGGPFSLADLRISLVAAAVNGDKVYSSIITSSIPLISVSTTFILFIDRAKNRKLLYLSLILSIIYCILNTGRDSLLLLISGLIAIFHIEKKSVLPFRKALFVLGAPIILLVSAMMAYMFATHVMGNSDYSTLIVGYFFLYLIGGIPALDSIVKSNNSNEPHHTFQFISQISNTLFGTHVAIPPPIDAFVNVPFPTNVYTVYKFYFQDFGFMGTLLTIIIIGMVHGILYRKAKTGSRYGIYFYALSMHPLLMSFFDDNYSNFRGHIRNSLVVIMCYFIIPELMNFFSRSNYEGNLVWRRQNRAK